MKFHLTFSNPDRPQSVGGLKPHFLGPRCTSHRRHFDDDQRTGRKHRLLLAAVWGAEMAREPFWWFDIGLIFQHRLYRHISRHGWVVDSIGSTTDFQRVHWFSWVLNLRGWFHQIQQLMIQRVGDALCSSDLPHDRWVLPYRWWSIYIPAPSGGWVHPI